MRLYEASDDVHDPSTKKAEDCVLYDCHSFTNELCLLDSQTAPDSLCERFPCQTTVSMDAWPGHIRSQVEFDSWDHPSDRPLPSSSLKASLEIQMVWPLCIASDSDSMALTVQTRSTKPGASGRDPGLSEEDASSCPLPSIFQDSSFSSRICILASACGNKLAQSPVLNGRATFSFSARKEVKSVLASAPKRAGLGAITPLGVSRRRIAESSLSRAGSGSSTPLNSSSPSTESNVQVESDRKANFWSTPGELSLLTVFCTDEVRADEAGPAASLLCAPSCVEKELERLFLKISSDLLELQGSTSNMTLRDVHGFSLLLGGRSSHSVTDLIVSSTQDVHSAPGTPITQPSSANRLDHCSSFNSPKAFTYDGTFARASTSSLGGPILGISSLDNRFGTSGDTEQGRKALRRRSTPVQGSIVPNVPGKSLDAVLCVMNSNPENNPGRGDSAICEAIPQSLLSEDTPLDGACLNESNVHHSTWKNYFQPLMQDLSYLLTCVPGACGPGEWDERTYMDTLGGVVEFLHHHSMWATLAAILRHSETAGVIFLFQGKPVPCRTISAESFCNLVATSSPMDLELQHLGQLCSFLPCHEPEEGWRSRPSGQIDRPAASLKLSSALGSACGTPSKTRDSSSSLESLDVRYCSSEVSCRDIAPKPSGAVTQPAGSRVKSSLSCASSHGACPLADENTLMEYFSPYDSSRTTLISDPTEEVCTFETSYGFKVPAHQTEEVAEGIATNLASRVSLSAVRPKSRSEQIAELNHNLPLEPSSLNASPDPSACMGPSAEPVRADIRVCGRLGLSIAAYDFLSSLLLSLIVAIACVYLRTS